MRPKIVLLTLLVAFAVIGAVAMLKGSNQKAANQDAAAQDSNAVSVAAAPVAKPQTASSDAPAVPSLDSSDETRAIVISKELDEIHELVAQADGSNNPGIIATLAAKLANPERQVRDAALDGLKQLNDTNAIPGLKQAADNVKDPREKVAIMDVIDFIKMPGITENLPINTNDVSTNATARVHPHRKHAPGASGTAPAPQ